MDHATGVPPSYVNVIFIDVPDGNYLMAGEPSTHSAVSGAIRVGRDVATRQTLLRNLSQMWARLTGQPEEGLLISLWENPAETGDLTGRTILVTGGGPIGPQCTRGDGASKPRARARVTASVRRCTPSLAKMWRECVRTVFSDTDSSPAISRADKLVGRYRSTRISP
jgi:hypothetical protein